MFIIYFISNDWLVKNRTLVFRYDRLQNGPNSFLLSLSMPWFWAWVTLLALANRMLANTIQKQNRIEKYMSYYLSSAIAMRTYPLSTYLAIPYEAILKIASQLTFIHDGELFRDRRTTEPTCGWWATQILTISKAVLEWYFGGSRWYLYDRCFSLPLGKHCFVIIAHSVTV